MTKRREKTEQDLQAAVNEAEGLTLGYIGNFERWGDDRLLKIWINNMWYTDGAKNQMYIWSGEAKNFTTQDYYTAMNAIRLFGLGRTSYAKAIGEE